MRHPFVQSSTPPISHPEKSVSSSRVINTRWATLWQTCACAVKRLNGRNTAPSSVFSVLHFSFFLPGIGFFRHSASFINKNGQDSGGSPPEADVDDFNVNLTGARDRVQAIRKVAFGKVVIPRELQNNDDDIIIITIPPTTFNIVGNSRHASKHSNPKTR